MNRAYPILLLALLTACSTRSTVSARLSPVPPPLPAALAAPCPPLNLLTNKTIAELATKDSEAARAYHACAVRHAAVVNAYLTAREAVQAWDAGE